MDKGHIVNLNNTFRKEMNFRDLGGYKTIEDRTVSRGLLYRSAALGLLNKEERKGFASLGIQTILDFRTRKAAQELPDPNFDGTDQYQLCAAFENFGEDLNYSPKEFFQMLIDEDQKGNTIGTVVSSIHSSLVYTNDAYKKMFELLLEERTPLLFHCSQGKDRTGIAAMLVLLALGVNEKQILQDYALSNEYRKSFIDRRMNKHKLLTKSKNVQSAILAVEGVLPEAGYMLLCEIQERYDNYETFFRKEYDLRLEDLKRLRDLYTE